MRKLSGSLLIDRKDPEVIEEFAETQAALAEEREARAGPGMKEGFFENGNFIRFAIALTIFVLKQCSSQNSVGYYTPRIFASIGYTDGAAGVVNIVATSIFVFFFVVSFGCKRSLQILALGVGIMFFIVGATFKTHSPPKTLSPEASPPSPSQAMAAILHIYMCIYSMGWGPLP